MKKASQRNDAAMEKAYVPSPIGTLEVAARDGAVCSIEIARENASADPAEAASPILTRAARELQAYFENRQTGFTFPMQAEGTDFQKRVWQALSQIPYGETRTYGQIAAVIGSPKGSRAVGMACNKNPIMIAVPCHRVVGANGRLVGFAYGTQMKQQLLDLEQRER